MVKVRIDPPQLTAQQIERFWSYVDKSPGQGPKGECWAWTKARSRHGYGRTRLGPRNNRRAYSAHRLSFFWTYGYWPALYVCHTCDWTPCCNPSHLYEGTQKMNAEDREKRTPYVHGCAKKLTKAQVVEIRALCNSRDVSQRAIAKQYGITQASVSHIGLRKQWEHI